MSDKKELNSEIINMSVNKRYLDFASNIKEIMSQKMQNHTIMKTYSNNVSNINSLKDKFLNITNPSED